MHQTTHFFNLGYGWLCKHCSAETAERKQQNRHNHAAHNPQPLALAKWIDESRSGLICPRCGIFEQVRRM
jgi:hypothetical protein